MEDGENEKAQAGESRTEKEPMSHGETQKEIDAAQAEEAGRIAQQWRESRGIFGHEAQGIHGPAPFHHEEPEAVKQAAQEWSEATEAFARRAYFEGAEKGYQDTVAPGEHRCDCFSCKARFVRIVEQGWEWYRKTLLGRHAAEAQKK